MIRAGLALGLALVGLPGFQVAAASSSASKAAPPISSAGRAAHTSAATLDVHAYARAFAPGEIVRIVVQPREPLTSIEGRFLEAGLFFTAEPPAPAGESVRSPTPNPEIPGEKEPPPAWSAWGVIPLDGKPGRTNISVTGTAADGERVSGALSVTVARKKFPEQRLTVDEKLVTPPPEVEERIAQETKLLASIYKERRAVPPPVAPFERPVEGEQTGVFGTRRIFNGKPRPPHPGLDLRAATGTPVKVAGPGLVVLAQDLYFSGNTVIVDHGGGLFTIYAHLSRIDVRDGEPIPEGQTVGLSGATGRVTGPHLHWGGKLGERAFDPMGLLSPALFR